MTKQNILKHLKSKIFIYFSISVLFVFYSIQFITQTSFEINNTRYYSLFDDAMISLRYAYNFSQGHGLVWNIDEHVEGYTNFFWVILLSILTFVFDRLSAIFYVQFFGCLIGLLVGWVSLKIADKFGLVSITERMLILLAVYFYYPLIYWFLFGMETSLVTLLLLLTLYMTLEYIITPSKFKSLFIGILFSLLYLTRPDSLYYILIFTTFLFINENHTNLLSRNFKKITFNFFTPFIIFTSVFLIHTLFRYLYYQALIPNTVLLKVVGFPTKIRVETGLIFVLEYLLESIIPFLLIVFGFFYIKKSLQVYLLYVLVFSTVIYQIYVGGDAWNYWRFFVPIFPIIVLICLKIVSENFSLIRASLIQTALLLLILLTCNWRFFDEWTFKERPYQVKYNKANVEYALKLKEFLEPNGKVAVFWAGTIPYYTDYYFIDILGKMDKTIASKDIYINNKADFGKRTVPGHNKFDLEYSLIKLKPDVAQNVAWMNQNAGNFEGFTFESFKYKNIEYWINLQSPNVDFAKIREEL